MNEKQFEVMIGMLQSLTASIDKLTESVTEMKKEEKRREEKNKAIETLERMAEERRKAEWPPRYTIQPQYVPPTHVLPIITSMDIDILV